PGPVHPHARGDNGDVVRPDSDGIGSPPRAWGQLLVLSYTPFVIRFTPTRVGTTVTASRKLYWIAVHPHARGDNRRQPSRRAAAAGSPPRAWGQPEVVHPKTAVCRFTP